MSRDLVAGVDIGGSKVLAAVLDPAGQVLAQVRMPTLLGVEGVVATTTRAVHQALTHADARLSDLRATGVGIPGLVDHRSGTVANAVNLDFGAAPVALGDELSALLDVPVAVENDVNAAALGAHLLAGTPDADLALLSMGTGLAAGIVLEGRLHRGARGAAGEIGHVPVDPTGAWCSCGQRGCLETMASGSALSAAWQSPNGRTVWQAAGAGDPAAAAAVHDFAGGVAAAVRLLVLTWDVDTVVLAGGVTEVGEPFAQAVRAGLDEAEQGSSLLASLHLADRVQLLPTHAPVAAIGAAAAARTRFGLRAVVPDPATATVSS